MAHLSVHLIVYSLLVLVAALLFNFSADGDVVLGEKHVLLAKSQRESFDIVGDLERLSEWFPGVTGFIEVESGPKTRGKRYRETINLPVIGNMYYVHTLMTYDSPRTIELQDDSWLKLKYKIWFYAQESVRGEARTMMGIKVSAGLRTYWFQYLAAPVFQFMYDQRLRSACFNVRMLVDHF